MKRFLWIIIVIILINALFVSTSFTTQNIPEDLEKRLQGIRTLKGLFIQETYIKALGRKQVFEGEFFMKKPDKFMWLYKKGSTDRIYINGERIIIYQPSEHQAFVTQKKRIGISGSPLRMLMDIEELQRDFKITTHNNRLILTPANSSAMVKNIELQLAKDSGLIQKIILHDIYDNKTTIEISHVTINEPIEDDVFKFKPPEGTTIINQ
ncbi:MAG: outer membrane lipoprotein chaperone LolA [Nitrospirae bacterium]|nr:outer membrane lipoprotein chaperone LolA [Nitrospirota bacterium]